MSGKDLAAQSDAFLKAMAQAWDTGQIQELRKTVLSSFPAEGLSFMPIRECEVLRRRGQGETLHSIGVALGYTGERIRQLEIKALQRIRRKMDCLIGTEG